MHGGALVGDEHGDLPTALLFAKTLSGWDVKVFGYIGAEDRMSLMAYRSHK
jgi:hypothetical protein